MFMSSFSIFEFARAHSRKRIKHVLGCIYLRMRPFSNNLGPPSTFNFNNLRALWLVSWDSGFSAIYASPDRSVYPAGTYKVRSKREAVARCLVNLAPAQVHKWSTESIGSASIA